MKHLIKPRIILASLLFAMLNSLVILGVGKLAVGYWGRPRGVAYGILGYYQWLFLSIIGLATVIIFRVMPIRYALLTSIAIITVPTVWMMPNTGERPFLSASIAAVLMCLVLGLSTKIFNKRRGPRR
jgi:hypothetical protein